MEKKNGSKLDIESLSSTGDNLEEDTFERDVVDEVNTEDKDDYGPKGGGGVKSLPMPLLLGIGAVIALLLAFTIFGGDSEEGGSGGKSVVGSILSFGKDDKPTVEEPIEGDNLIETIMLELKADYDGYEITHNVGNKQIEVKGTTPDGSSHDIYYSEEGEILNELLDGASLTGNAEVIGKSQSTPVNVPAQEVIQNQSKDAVTGEELVTVKLSDYNKTQLSLPLQSLTQQLDEYGNEIVEEYTSRYIVQYEKMPLRGKTPTIYSVVIETGEKIIFHPTLKEYMKLEDKGTTVLEIDITKMHGVEVFDRIRIYEINR